VFLNSVELRAKESGFSGIVEAIFQIRHTKISEGRKG
jgi:hypothetical protein